MLAMRSSVHTSRIPDIIAGDAYIYLSLIGSRIDARDGVYWKHNLNSATVTGISGNG